MKITTITVHAETRFNDPHEQFRNHCPSVTLTAELAHGDNTDLAVRSLHTIAALYLQEERESIIRKRAEERAIEIRTAKIERFTQALECARGGLTRNEAELAALKALNPPAESWQVDNIEEEIEDNQRTIADCLKALAELGEPALKEGGSQ